MKRIAAVATALCFALGAALLTGCGGGSPAEDTPAGEGAASEGASAEGAAEDEGESYVLTYSYFTSESIGPGLFITEVAKNIAERSNGRLTLDLYFNGTLPDTGDVITGCII
jgi:TRAP-type C4-dicarboxylate transport system substrate-binding protein